jgi:hypothetical protein
MYTLRRIRHSILKTAIRRPLVWGDHRGVGQRDCFVASYPRSGSTWLRFLLAEVLTGKGSQFGMVNELIPDVGAHRKAKPILPGGGNLIKTHESYRREYKKAVYLVRDVRDVLLSEHAYQQALGLVGDDLDSYITAFFQGKVNPYGAWQNHVRSWLDSPLGGTENLLLIKFDELRLSTEDTLSRILTFLGAKVDSKLVHDVVLNNALDKMRAKEKQSPQRASRRGRFVRNGAVGGWRESLTAEQLAFIDRQAGRELEHFGYPSGVAEPSAMPLAGIR